MANGLVTMNTDLKSLGYSTNPLGSKSPYVTKRIGDNSSSDFQVRIDDLSRIAKMLTDKPGINYLTNETKLKQINVGKRIAESRAAGKSVVGAILKEVAGTIGNAIKIVGSTLLQVPVNGTGTHFLKGFRTDTYYRPIGEEDDGPSAIGRFFGAGGVEGAPIVLNGGIVEGTVNSNHFTPGEYENDVPTLNNFIDKYQAGPTFQEQLDIFETFGEDLTAEQNYTYLDSLKRFRYGNKGNITKESAHKMGEAVKPGDLPRQDAIRKGKWWFVSEKIDEYSGVDRVNAQYPSTPSTSVEKVEKLDGKDAIPLDDVTIKNKKSRKDLIKFNFQIITPEVQTKAYFRAFLDTFSDSYTGQWNQVKYIGRAEDLQLYGGFQRKISLSFKIAASSRVEMHPLYQKMVLLASATAPTYSNRAQFMRGTLLKLNIGDYLKDQLGVLNSLTYTWQKEYPWDMDPAYEIEDDTYPDVEGKNSSYLDSKASKIVAAELPMILDCQMEFTPIHDFTPVTGITDAPYFGGRSFLKQTPYADITSNAESVVAEFGVDGLGSQADGVREAAEAAATAVAAQAAAQALALASTIPKSSPNPIVTP